MGAIHICVDCVGADRTALLPARCDSKAAGVQTEAGRGSLREGWAMCMNGIEGEGGLGGTHLL